MAAIACHHALARYVAAKAAVDDADDTMLEEDARMLTRRDVMLGSVALTAVLAAGMSAQAQSSLNMTEVLAAADPALPDLVYGPAEAKVTIIEYASTTDRKSVV